MPRQDVMSIMMQLVDEYVVMSYNTNPANAMDRILAQAKYASKSHGPSMPRVLGSVETAKRVGTNVSYADTPGKQSKGIVLADVGRIEAALRQYPAFRGMAIHHWAAWNELPP